MAGNFDRSLDEIINSLKLSRQQNGRFTRGNRGNLTKPYRKPQRPVFPKGSTYTPLPSLPTDFVSNKLNISNLDYGVTESDLHALFEEHGPLKALTMHYDRMGRSLGTADITYEWRQDACRAFKVYNGVPLDGRQMHIEFSLPSRLPQQQIYVPPIKEYAFGYGPVSLQRRRDNFNRRGSYGRTFQATPESKNAPNNSRRDRSQKRQPTLEELDAELDDYVSNHSKNK